MTLDLKCRNNEIIELVPLPPPYKLSPHHYWLIIIVEKYRKLPWSFTYTVNSAEVILHSSQLNVRQKLSTVEMNNHLL